MSHALSSGGALVHVTCAVVWWCFSSCHMRCHLVVLQFMSHALSSSGALVHVTVTCAVIWWCFSTCHMRCHLVVVVPVSAEVDNLPVNHIIAQFTICKLQCAL